MCKLVFFPPRPFFFFFFLGVCVKCHHHHKPAAHLSLYIETLTAVRIKDYREKNKTEEGRAALRTKFDALRPSIAWDDEIREDLGRWFASYLEHAGYGRVPSSSAKFSPRIY